MKDRNKAECVLCKSIYDLEDVHPTILTPGFICRPCAKADLTYASRVIRHNGQPKEIVLYGTHLAIHKGNIKAPEWFLDFYDGRLWTHQDPDRGSYKTIWKNGLTWIDEFCAPGIVKDVHGSSKQRDRKKPSLAPPLHPPKPTYFELNYSNDRLSTTIDVLCHKQDRELNTKWLRDALNDFGAGLH